MAHFQKVYEVHLPSVLERNPSYHQWSGERKILAASELCLIQVIVWITTRVFSTSQYPCWKNKKRTVRFGNDPEYLRDNNIFHYIFERNFAHYFFFKGKFLKIKSWVPHLAKDFQSALMYFKMCFYLMTKTLLKNNMGVIHKYMKVSRQQSSERIRNLKITGNKFEILIYKKCWGN